MPILNCYVDERTLAILIEASGRLGRTVDELAEAAIEETAFRGARDLGIEVAALNEQPRTSERGKCPSSGDIS